MSKRIWLLAVLALAALGVATVAAHGEGDVEHGAALYAENCLACHGAQGEARVDTHPAFASTVAYDLDFTEVVAQGVPGTYMGAWGEAYGGPLSEADLADLDVYVASWSEGGAPALPAPEAPEGLDAEASTGAELYAVNCAGCHGDAGEGRGLEDYPALGRHADMLTATRRGVGDTLMPPFAQDNGGPLTEDEIGQIMAYTRTWEYPNAVEARALELEDAELRGVGPLVLLMGLIAIGIVALAVLMPRWNGPAK